MREHYIHFCWSCSPHGVLFTLPLAGLGFATVADAQSISALEVYFHPSCGRRLGIVLGAAAFNEVMSSGLQPYLGLGRL